MLEWEEGDRFSFDDSERFEDDSDCSWLSEPESLCNNWRGWKKANSNNASSNSGSFLPAIIAKPREPVTTIKSLAELSARTVAAQIPFEVVEQMMPVVPEQIQLWIAYWSFPDNEEDIRLYSCLANGQAEEFLKGENLYKHNCIEDVLQIGFHLSATVSILTGSKDKYKVAVTFDRARVTTCNCTCSSTASWCSHVVAVCLHRIHQPTNVKLRAPVSESLSRLQRDQLQKFAQYLISELPQQILPTAQRLIDEILSSQSSDINTVSGAPDPTAGASASEQTAWWLDENNLHDNIHKILVKFCIPSPMILSDVNYLSSTAPPVALEWQTLLRPLRGREPEGMWNLLSIVREMFKRHDHNAIPLLEIITEECLATEKILVWWVNTRLALHSGNSGHSGKNNVNSNSHNSQYACSSLCDEIVSLWRLAALNPALSPSEREMLRNQFKEWHLKILEKVAKTKEATSTTTSNRDSKRTGDIEVFPGFKPAIEACLLNWNDYSLPGITYSHAASRYYCPVMCCKHDPNHEPLAAPISAPLPRMPPQYVGLKRQTDCRIACGKHVTGWNALCQESREVGMGPSCRSQRSSSISSEGFCDNDIGRDSDSSHELHSTEQDSGQVSRQNSREDHRLPNDNKRDFDRGNVGLLRASPVYNLSDQDQACNLDDLECDRRLGEDLQKRNEHHNFNDDYRMYVYNPRLVHEYIDASGDHSENDKDTKGASGTQTSSDKTTSDVFANIKKLDDPLEILLARAEGLHAHGHVQEASRLAVQLAEELLAHPPNLMIDVGTPSSKSRRKKGNPASHQLTCLASATLAKCAFLCSVLAENPEHNHLAFQVALFGLEMPRPPASTKPLEVKLAYQESDLVTLLRKLPLGPKELLIIREKADQLRTGTYNTRGEALLPLVLAEFVFDALVASASMRIAVGTQNYRRHSDENLGFEASVAALAMKANISEADHPLLCEGTRRQRRDLGLTLLTYYKDDQDRLAVIMDKFLDKEVHQMYKAPSLSNYYANNSNNQPVEGAEGRAPDPHVPVVTSPPATSTSSIAPPPGSCPEGPVRMQGKHSNETLDQALARLVVSPSESTGGARPKTNTSRFPESEEESKERANEASAPASFELPAELQSATWEEEFKEWDQKVNKHRKKKSGHNFASSNDTSETFVHNFARGGSVWAKQAGPGSDSGSSGNSSDSIGSLSSGEKGGVEGHKPVESPPLGFPIVRPPPHSTPESIIQPRPIPFGKGVRYKGKRAYPTIPNQPSEASAYFMFELAKTVLNKAGGTSSTTLFKQPTNTQNHRGPHRALQMCAFQIGLYALGLNNCVSPNWLSRTYSSHVSWISNQATEIGAPALSFLIDTWEGHLTPQEAASIADRASRGRDTNTIRQAARLALSCLPHAHALNPNEIQRAIIQCKEQSSSMLEGACLAVEGAAKGGGVYPEVLFSVARCWHDLYEAKTRQQARHNSRRGPRDLHHDMHQQHINDMHIPQFNDTSPIGKVATAISVASELTLAPPPMPPVSFPTISSISQPVNVGHLPQPSPQLHTVETISSVTVHPSVSIDVATSMHSNNGMPSYPVGTASTSVGYGIPGLPYPLGYNYLQNIASNLPCITPQLPVQMYIHSPGVPLSGPHGSVSQPVITTPPPPALQSLQYYPPVSIPSSLGQGTAGVNICPGGQPSLSSQITVNNQTPTSQPTLPSTMASSQQHHTILHGSHPVQQGFYPLSYSGSLIPPGGFLGGGGPASTHVPPPPPPPPAAILPFVRTSVAPHQPPPQMAPQTPPSQPPPPTQQHQVRSALVGNQQHIVSNSTSMHYLLSAYRVGMLAMETLARRVQDDRPQAKYAKNPAYGEDVKWLLGIAKKLGTHYLHQFCLCSVNSVVSPFVLYELAVEVASYLSRNSPALYHQHLRSPILQPLIQKCQQMFIQCTQLKMYYIAPTDYDEFVSIVRAARQAFQMTPGGIVQFNELLQALRRSKCCKKELWQRITSALQQPTGV